MLSGGKAGSHPIEGGGVGFVPTQLTRDRYDEVIAVSTDEASAMARATAPRWEILSGLSTGANLVAAARIARRLGAGSTVVAVPSRQRAQISGREPVPGKLDRPAQPTVNSQVLAGDIGTVR